MKIKKGATDISIYVVLVDSAAGTPKTGLTITNIDATYTRNRAAATKNDLTALGAANSAHADNQGIEVDSTNAPGLYRVDFPDAAFATGVDKVILSVTCSGAAPAHLIVELCDYDDTDFLRPTTSGRTLDVTATGEAGIDWSNIGSPTTTVNLSGTTVKTATDVETDTADIQSRLPAALVGGRMDSNASAISGDSVAADNLEAMLDGTGGVTLTTGITGNITGNLSGSVGSVTGAVGSVTGNVGGNVTGSVGSLTGFNVTGTSLTAIPWNASWDAEVQSEVQDAIEVNNLDHLVKSAVDTNFATTVHLDSVIGHLADAGGTATFDRTTDALEILGAATAPSAATIADAVWDETLADHLTAGSTGNALNAAGSAGDPWATALPGAYGAGTAGRLIGRSLPDIVAGSAGGLLIAGSNAATTFATLTVTGNMAVGGDFDITGSLSLGVGFEVGGGVTVSGATSLAAVTTTGTVTLNALTVSGATTFTGAITGTNAGNDIRLGATQNAATADKLLNRNINQGGDGTRTVEEALAFLRNKWSISGTTLTVTDVDDVTTLWTSTVSTNASADPITGNDPA